MEITALLRISLIFCIDSSMLAMFVFMYPTFDSVRVIWVCMFSTFDSVLAKFVWMNLKVENQGSCVLLTRLSRR